MEQEKHHERPQRRASVVSSQRRSHILRLLHDAASKAVKEDDPWGKYEIPKHCPAERVIRHLYDPVTQQWTADETIVKMEPEPFTHGAMRFCYRMKKMAQPPQHSSSNHRFYRHGWSRASNYVAKAYQKDGVVDTSDEAKRAVQNDILLQYEAQHWAMQFNSCEPPTKITFIRAYAIEFPDRDGKPWFAVERYIAGRDWYGVGFVKHNTNAGFVDQQLRRVTPQVFSAYTFYKSRGHRLVADIQGVGDLYTDPQVLSSDYRFGDGDLGPRGMALFFKSFRHCGISDSMGIPIFKLSRNELKVQAKYEDDEETMSSSDDGMSHSHASHDLSHLNMDRFQCLDHNRLQRRSILQKYPPVVLSGLQSLIEEEDENNEESSRRPTLRRANLSRREVSESFRNSLTMQHNPKKLSMAPPRLKRSKSDFDEVEACLHRALRDKKFCLYKDFHRTETGELRQRHFHSHRHVDESVNDNENKTNAHDSSGNKIKDAKTTDNEDDDDSDHFHKSNNVRHVSPPMIPDEETRINIGKVHYQLAILHGMDRFPECVHPDGDDHPPKESNGNEKKRNGVGGDEEPTHDSFSVLFHLSHAASLQNVPALLALGRVLSGLDTVVSHLLKFIVPTDFERAKDMLARAMSSPQMTPGVAPKVAAGCLLYQILSDEASLKKNGSIPHDNEDDADENTSSNNETGGDATKSSCSLDIRMQQTLQETLALYDMLEKEEKELKQHKERRGEGSTGTVGRNKSFHVGDRVEGNYFLEGTYYAGTVIEVLCDSDNGTQRVTVQYDDDGSTETLTAKNVRLLVPPTATQTNLGGPLSDEEAFGELGANGGDAKPVLTYYEIEAELAEFKEKDGVNEAAAEFYQDAADRAMQDGKMKSATAWSLKAAELMP